MLGDPPGGPVFVRSEVFGRGPDDLSDDKASEDHPEEFERQLQEEHHRSGRHEHQGAGTEDARAQRPEQLRHGRGVTGTHEERAQDGRQDANASDDQRQHRERAVEAAFGNAEGHSANRDQGQCRDHRPDIRFEQVGAHAGDVADVVTDVVRDGGRVARVILGDARFDLADEVGSDVSRLGVDTAADAGEERDRRCAEGEARHDGSVLEDEPKRCYAEQADADHGQAHDGAGAEGHAQCRVQADHGRGGSTHVAAHRDAHADEARKRRAEGADDVADGSPGTFTETLLHACVELRDGGVVGQVEVDEDGDQDGHQGDEAREDGVLGLEEGHRALLDQPTDLADTSWSGVVGDDRSSQGACRYQADDGRGEGDDECRCSGHQREYRLSSTAV